MHIRCGLGCRLSGKTFVRAIANYLAVHLRHSSSTALPSICYPPEKMKCYGRVEGGTGRRRRARGWVGCRTCFTTRLTHPRDVVGRHGAELDGGAEA